MCPTIFDPANLELDVIPDQELSALSINQNPTVESSFLGQQIQPKNRQDQMHKVCSLVSFKVMLSLLVMPE
jgi:hypothetical protein